MAYQLHIPVPKSSRQRARPVSVTKVITPVSNWKPCIKNLKGLIADSVSLIDQRLLRVDKSIYWRGDMARSWLLFYLTQYHQVSDVFLTQAVGLADLASTVKSLQGKKYRVPINATAGTDEDQHGNLVPCVYYSLDESLVRVE
ncbi:hypothetical protein [uncultured Methylophaga sp.]|uniref:hypothetical protein n=1 Tax=uncultured Methylophaga sp. TaxID=285271 RepID=UPI00262A3CDF|nr:hypothetical protein [uncultured Methylophaga sp.]